MPKSKFRPGGRFDAVATKPPDPWFFSAHNNRPQKTTPQNQRQTLLLRVQRGTFPGRPQLEKQLEITAALGLRESEVLR
jgi:hypothetical protein